MKKKLFTFLILTYSFVHFKTYSQEGIYLYSASLPGDITTGVHRDETLIKSFSRSIESNTTFTAGGGASVGRAISNGITILKPYSRPSLTIKEKLFMGLNIPKMELRFYNNADVMYYKITLGTVFVVNFLENAEICLGGCPDVSEEIKFVFGIIKEEDLLLMTSKCWNFMTGAATCPP
jgi:type VI protein secretion system component Hcp